MQLTKNQRVFIVKYYTGTISYKQVKEKFEKEFPDRTSPSKSTIHDTERKCNNVGTVLNRNKGNSGRLKTIRTEGNIAHVRHLIEENPKISCRRNPSVLSKSAFSRTVQKELQFYPYKSVIQQKLLDHDLLRCRAFCQWFLNRPNEFLERLVVGDEAAFHMNGKINKQINRYYSPKNYRPENAVSEVPFSREKMSVWAGLCDNGIVLGPIFYETNLTGETYFQMLNETVIPELKTAYDDHSSVTFGGCKMEHSVIGVLL
ncbi:Protein of unknown function DUF4817 [Trinorchestia longiramus]|nr:Protein of unknown function DUF4817 [Trinorchestia longiramus]